MARPRAAGKSRSGRPAFRSSCNRRNSADSAAVSLRQPVAHGREPHTDPNGNSLRRLRDRHGSPDPLRRPEGVVHRHALERDRAADRQLRRPASAAIDPATITANDWDFGDGSGHGSGVDDEPPYAAGTYTARLTVTHSNNMTATTTKQISSGNTPPSCVDPDLPNAGRSATRSPVHANAPTPRKGARGLALHVARRAPALPQRRRLPRARPARPDGRQHHHLRRAGPRRRLVPAHHVTVTDSGGLTLGDDRRATRSRRRCRSQSTRPACR